MKIEYLGHSAFILKDKEVTVVCDPFHEEAVGLKFPKIEAEIVTISHNHIDHNAKELIKGEVVVFDFPGEYERKGVRIFGYQTFHDIKEGAERGENLLFKIIIDGVVVLHCGDLGHLPNGELIEQIKDTDVLLVPVGGAVTLDAKEAAKLVDLIKPEVIIPMHFQSAKQIEKGVKSPLQTVEPFLKIMGVENLTPVDKLVISADNLPEKEVVLLQA